MCLSVFSDWWRIAPPKQLVRCLWSVWWQLVFWCFDLERSQNGLRLWWRQVIRKSHASQAQGFLSSTCHVSGCKMISLTEANVKTYSCLEIKLSRTNLRSWNIETTWSKLSKHPQNLKVCLNVWRCLKMSKFEAFASGKAQTGRRCAPSQALESKENHGLSVLAAPMAFHFFIQVRVFGIFVH